MQPPRRRTLDEISRSAPRRRSLSEIAAQFEAEKPEKPSLLETAGMVARGIPAAIGGEVALTGAKLSGALGFEEAAE